MAKYKNLLLILALIFGFCFGSQDTFARNLQDISAGNSSSRTQKTSPRRQSYNSYASSPQGSTPRHRVKAVTPPQTPRVSPGSKQAGSNNSALPPEYLDAIRRSLYGDSQPNNNNNSRPHRPEPGPRPERRTALANLPQVTINDLTSRNRPSPRYNPEILKIRDKPILFIAFPDLKQQSATLGRIAHYTEGNIGQIISQRALQNLDPPSACDFYAEGIAGFYNAFVQSQRSSPQLQLTSGEVWFRDQLLNLGVLKYGGNKYSTGQSPFAVVSYAVDPSFVSRPGLLNFIIEHEYNHALFYTNPAYRRETAALWNRLPESTQRHIEGFLKNKHYDMQGYLGNINQGDIVKLKEFVAYYRDYDWQVRRGWSIGDAENSVHREWINWTVRRLRQIENPYYKSLREYANW